jgi:hypothetical protein
MMESPTATVVAVTSAADTGWGTNNKEMNAENKSKVFFIFNHDSGLSFGKGNHFFMIFRIHNACNLWIAEKDETRAA